MKIVVCVKVLAEAPRWLRIDPVTLRVAREGAGILNAPDKHAVEEALRVKEALGDCEVLVVSMAPSEAVPSVREGLLMGADRALLIADDSAAGSDVLATSRVLAKALQREDGDLVLFGQQGDDSNGSLLWASVAERLDLPVISRALRIELAEGRVRARRQTELGYDMLEAPLPCVVAVSSAINEPRYPTFREMKAAAPKACTVLSLSDLELTADDAGEAGSGTVVHGLSDPPPRGERKVIKDDGNAAEAILEYLVSKALI